MKEPHGVGWVEAASGKTVPKLRPYPLLLCFGLLNAGFFLQVDQTSPIQTLFFDSAPEANAVLFASGSLISAVILLIALSGRTISCSALNRLSVSWIAGIVLAVAACLIGLGTSPVLTTLMKTGVFLSGSCMPLAFVSWMLAYKRLSLRNCICNSALAFLVFAAVIGLGTAIDPIAAFAVCMVSLLAGAVAYIPVLRTHRVQEPEPGPKNAEVAHPSPIQLATSVPMIGVAVSAFTTGCAFSISTSPSLDTSVACFVAGIALLVFSLTAVSTWAERKLSYAIFRIAFPAIAASALIVKMIPIDVIANALFRDYMFLLFQLFTLSTWIYLTNLLRNSSRSAAFVCGLAQGIVQCSLLLGYATGIIGYPWNKGIMGLVTAAFLIFAAIQLGRNIILYSEGTETNTELTDKILDIESSCNMIGTEYRLSPRETEVLVELAYGHASSYVAKVLYISNNTARTHMKNIYRKLDVKSREDLLELIRKTQKSLKRNDDGILGRIGKAPTTEGTRGDHPDRR